ncbi:MAG: hypothetical protein JJT81_06520 [Rubellimicrobium sp.]|nr:hypothetical protein [Rubellimicrobium sp.]
MSAALLLDTLLPGDEAFPPGHVVAEALAAHDRFGPALERILALLPEDFASQPPEARVTTLAAIEATHSEAFSALVLAAYSLYYTHPKVAAVLEASTGYRAGPPQPGGHALAPFDPALLAIPAVRAPLYRPTPEAET